MLPLPLPCNGEHQEALDCRWGMPSPQWGNTRSREYRALWQARTSPLPCFSVDRVPRGATGNVGMHRMWRGRVHPRTRPSVAVHRCSNIS